MLHVESGTAREGANPRCSISSSSGPPLVATKEQERFNRHARMQPPLRS